VKLHPAQIVADINGLMSETREETKVQVIDFSGGIKEVQSVVVAATASVAQGDFIILEDTAGLKYAFWMDIDAAGTQPAGILYSAANVKTKVSIITGGTAPQNAALLKTKIDSTSAFGTTSISTATVSVPQLLTGDATAPVRKNAAENGNGSFTVATVTGGVIPTLNSKYFTFDKSGTAYYAWFNVNGKGSDPAPGGTGVEIVATGEESASAVAALAAAAINALAGITSVNDGSILKIVVDAVGNITNATAGNTGLSVDVRAQGADGLLSPGGNYATSSPVTSIISPLT
jgi:hypothetical protein